MLIKDMQLWQRVLWAVIIITGVALVLLAATGRI